ncbi:hypothetical protein [Mangrovibacterium diazotrophicum]|uniref:Uncharacterized protein n=1 Tax=Mangrovibacterium diazotrophicum TaxID=1261403 RepID=A0A419W7W3_9BACT|nr:hypothetical protein [Mangrovibacterium diazotrophicum]RKD91567.1 hypothetical protein BC643_1923 [Mangrovibacterium diazotrophicum]
MTTLLNRPTKKSIRIVYSALIMGLVFFSCMSFYLVHTTGPLGDFDEEAMEYLLLVANMLPLIAIPTGIFIARKRLSEIESTATAERLTQFQSAMIIRAATIEASGYFFLVCFALTGIHLLLVEALVMITLQVYFFPNNMRLSRELKLDLRELEKKQD